MQRWCLKTGERSDLLDLLVHSLWGNYQSFLDKLFDVLV